MRTNLLRILETIGRRAVLVLALAVESGDWEESEEDAMIVVVVEGFR